MKSRAAPYLFLAPFVTAFALFFVLPVAYAVYLSLFVRRRAGFGPARDVFGGLANYTRALQDAEFLASFANIAKFALVQVPLMLLLALGFALVLDASKGWTNRFFRTAFYIPYLVPSVIAGLLWGYLYSRNLSPFNTVLGSLGLGPVDFLSSSIILVSIGNIVTWTWTGYNMVVLYAALQNVPRELYEAATVDGATGWSVVRHIKLPLLRPALLLTLIFSIIGTSQIFAEPFVLRNIGYVPDNVTPNTYLYQVAARDANYAYAAALAVILALVTFAFSIVFLRLAARES